MVALPLVVEYDGRFLIPVNRDRAAERFQAGRRYQIEIVEHRSGESHRHYFAIVREAWLNLPHDLQARYPTAEHLRAWALVKAGYYLETTYVCETPGEAVRLTDFAATMIEFAIVVMKDNTVTVYRPKSQSYSAMDRAEFNASKQKVLEVLAELIGVTVEELTANAGGAA